MPRQIVAIMNIDSLRKALSSVEVLLDRGRFHLVLPQLIDAYIELGWLERVDGRLKVTAPGRKIISEQRDWSGKDPVR
jgi:hypothetical protein